MRLRFTVRDLLWLVVVVALAVGWILDRRNQIAEMQGWKDAFDRQLYMVEGLQEYFQKKHPDDPPIDWAELREIHRQQYQ